LANADDRPVLIFIPSFNDRERIADLCSQVLSLGENYSVLVVDDGSTPALAIPLRERLHVFRSPYNAGLGCATNIAMDYAYRRHFTALVRIDADGQHEPRYISTVMEPLLNGTADVAVGNRLNSLAGTALRDLLAGVVKRHVRFIANLVTGLQISDWHTGFMAFYGLFRARSGVAENICI
jgi:glycosyltransferase involved in cell wall biosynthesis